jgi:hypothetical protein
MLLASTYTRGRSFSPTAFLKGGRAGSAFLTATKSAGRLLPKLKASEEEMQKEKLVKLGFSDRELESRTKNEEPLKVNVNIVDRIDPFTMTTIGFALIAFNFFFLANMGDGGIAGTVARIINLSNQ